jgi:hypothetical protein
MFLLIPFLGYADTLIINKEGKDTYIQEEKFMLAEGENVLGSISLLPIIYGDFLKVELENGYVVSYVINHFSTDWKENLKGKEISIEGNGRFISGKVIEVQGDDILINTQKGLVITTLPKFPAKISIKGSFEKAFSPSVDLKVFSKEVGEQIIKLTYPVKGVNYKIKYIEEKDKLTPYFVIENNTPVNFENITLEIKGKLFDKTFKNFFLPAYSKKILKADIEKGQFEEGFIYKLKNKEIEEIKVFRK